MNDDDLQLMIKLEVDGEEREYVLADVVEYEGKEYALLAPVECDTCTSDGEECGCEWLVVGYSTSDDGITLSALDDGELECVIKRLEAMAAAEEEEGLPVVNSEEALQVEGLELDLTQKPNN